MQAQLGNPDIVTMIGNKREKLGIQCSVFGQCFVQCFILRLSFLFNLVFVWISFSLRAVVR